MKVVEEDSATGQGHREHSVSGYGSGIPFRGVSALQLKATRIIPVAEQVCFMTHAEGEYSAWRAMGQLREKVLEKTNYRSWALADDLQRDEGSGDLL